MHGGRSSLKREFERGVPSGDIAFLVGKKRNIEYPTSNVECRSSRFHLQNYPARLFVDTSGFIRYIVNHQLGGFPKETPLFLFISFICSRTLIADL